MKVSSCLGCGRKQGRPSDSESEPLRLSISLTWVAQRASPSTLGLGFSLYLPMPSPSESTDSANSPNLWSGNSCSTGHLCVSRCFRKTPCLTVQVDDANYPKRTDYRKPTFNAGTSIVFQALFQALLLCYPHIHTGMGPVGSLGTVRLLGSLAVCWGYCPVCPFSALGFSEVEAKSGTLCSTTVTMSNLVSACVLSVMGTSLPHGAAYAITPAGGRKPSPKSDPTLSLQ